MFGGWFWDESEIPPAPLPLLPPASVGMRGIAWHRCKSLTWWKGGGQHMPHGKRRAEEKRVHPPIVRAHAGAAPASHPAPVSTFLPQSSRRAKQDQGRKDLQVFCMELLDYLSTSLGSVITPTWERVGPTRLHQPEEPTLQELCPSNLLCWVHWWEIQTNTWSSWALPERSFLSWHFLFYIYNNTKAMVSALKTKGEDSVCHVL